MAEHNMEGAELASMMKGQVNAQQYKEGVDAEELHVSEASMKWWRDAKLGLFIHWGVYSVVGKGEWAYFNEKFTEEAYRKIAEEQFAPQRDPDEIAEEWIETAQKAGMKYAVMVTRHHDGFAMWDSRGSWKNFTSVQCGPKADYVKAFTEACRKNGMHTGLYYSPMDWRFPGYFDPEGEAESARQMKQQAYDQLEELCTRYGKVEILWYDGGWLAHQGKDADAAWLWEPIKMNRMVKALQPNILVTPRSGYCGDFACQEGAQEITGNIIPVPWEKCMSVSSTWGYCPKDHYYPAEYLIQMLVDAVCRDGNLILNIGPDPEGRIPKEEKTILEEVGKWMKENGESIYDTRGGIWEPVDGVYGSTWKENKVYLHILDCEKFAQVMLPSRIRERRIQIEKAELLDGTIVPFIQNAEEIRIGIPEEWKKNRKPDTIVRLTIGE